MVLCLYLKMNVQVSSSLEDGIGSEGPGRGVILAHFLVECGNELVMSIFIFRGQEKDWLVSMRRLTLHSPRV